MPEEKPLVKRTYKNSVFCDLFDDPENQREFYFAVHPGTEGLSLKDFRTVTINNILTDQPYNDLGFAIKDRLLILAEAQSSWSVNIIVRMMMYFAQTIKDHIHETGQNVYGSAKISISKPEFYVIYTGDKENIKESYSFAEEYFNGSSPFIDVKVNVLMLEDEKKRDIVTQYILFTKVVAEQVKIHGRTEEAIKKAIQICEDREILVDYLSARKKEVVSIMTTLFSQEEATKAYGIERERKGRMDGIRENELETAKRMIKSRKLSDEEIAEFSGLNLAQVKELKKEESVLA